MRHARSSTRAIGGAIAAAVAVLLLVAFACRHAIAQFAIEEIAGKASGTHVTLGSMRLGRDRAIFTRVRVRSPSGEPVASIDRIEVGYNLRDLFLGGKRLFGLKSLDIERPRITVVHHRDGTYNIPIPNQVNAKGGATTPLIFTARVRDGSLTIVDDTRVDPDARRLYVDSVNADLDFNTQARSRYAVALIYREDGHPYPLRGTGDIDIADGYMTQRWQAAQIPLARLVNYGVNSTMLRMASGKLTGIDARVFGLSGPDGTLQPHVAATAVLTDGLIAAKGLLRPVRNIRGRFDIYNGGLLTRRVDASLGGVPVRISGGIYDLHDPKVRLVLDGHGDLHQMREVAAAAARLPMSGPLRFRLTVEGAATRPVALVSFQSPRIEYNAIPLESPNGLAAFDGHEADIVGFGVHYAAIDMHARGRVVLQRAPNAVEMLLHVSAPASSVPYANGMVPGMMLRGSALATADDPKSIELQGVLGGVTATQEAAAAFHVSGQGVGTVGPVFIGNDRRSLYARVFVDHPHGQIAALADVHDFRVRPVRAVALPGFRLPPLPSVATTLDGRLFGTQDGSRLGIVGDAALRGTRIGTLAIDEAHARLGGTLGGVQVLAMQARGPWGALNGLNAMFALRGNAMKIYAAQAKIGGGSVIATGDVGTRGRLAVSATGVELAALRGAGMPVHSGNVSFGATIAGPAMTPKFDGAFVLNGAQYQRFPISGAAAVDFRSGTLSVRDATVGLGPALVGVSGSVGGLQLGRPPAPQYNVRLALRAADAQALASIVQPQIGNNVEGSIDADVHVGNSGDAPTVAGLLHVAEGAAHGLPFRDLSGRLSGGPGAVAVREGRITVGSTQVAFDAGASSSGAAHVAIRAPHADLSDFNDFFDTGDTLSGRGHLDFSLDVAKGDLVTNGCAVFAGAQFRRFDLGNAAAHWDTEGRTIRANLAFGGDSGRVRAEGRVALPSIVSLRTARTLASNATVDVHASAHAVDLNSWLPMLGVNAPVTGLLEGDATVRGRFPDVAVSTRADVRNGTVGRLPLERFHVAATVVNGHGSIESAVLQVPSLSATASGIFGLRAGDALRLAAHVVSPDIGALMAKASGKPIDAAGALDTTVHIDGTAADPRVSDRFTLTSLRYARFEMPRVTGELAVNRKAIALHGGEINLQRGRILVAASLPVQLQPFAIGPARAPVRLNAVADDVEASDIVNLLPSGTRMTGRIDGRVGLRGTVSAPYLDGGLTLANGYFAGPQETVPIADLDGRLALHGTTVSLQSLRANAGGGTFAASGTASVPNLRSAREVTLRLQASAKRVRVDLPAYFKGQIDGAITVVRNPGTRPLVAGEATISNARVPLSAFLNTNAPKTPAAKPPDIAFDLALNIGQDVRVQSPNVDIGGTGRLVFGGTLAAPALRGRIVATGGTLDFYRHFRIQNGVVQFDPASGIMPRVDAVATTHVTDPDTDITLHVTGKAPSDLNLDLASDPSYSRAQILGLLVGAQQFGAVAGVQSSGSGTGFSASSALGGVALGQLNQVFTRSLLEPLSTQLGGALGLSNLQLYNDLGIGFGASALKSIGKHASLSFAESFGSPRRSSVTLQVQPSQVTAISLTAYQQQQIDVFGGYTPQTVGQNIFEPAPVTIQQTNRNNGVSLLLQRKYR
ncbi:MAG: translocation/assembly module TamB domain-containing protein [Vulcanimicrobiaceae bacterium]